MKSTSKRNLLYSNSRCFFLLSSFALIRCFFSQNNKRESEKCEDEERSSSSGWDGISIESSRAGLNIKRSIFIQYARWWRILRNIAMAFRLKDFSQFRSETKKMNKAFYGGVCVSDGAKINAASFIFFNKIRGIPMNYWKQKVPINQSSVTQVRTLGNLNIFYILHFISHV